MLKSTILLFLLSFSFFLKAQNSYFVDVAGDNSNSGSIISPWATIQFGVSQLSSGDTLNIKAGTYLGKIDIQSSGTNTQNITIRNYNGEEVIVNGATLQDYEYLLKIEDVEYITVQGIKFQDYQKLDAIGLLVINSSNILIENNEFSNIDYSNSALGETPIYTQNSQPIIVFGRDPINPIENITINNNIIHDCETGWSECLSINGNVDGFKVLNNEIYNNTNIPIVAIGHEGECSDPVYDQARNGLIKGNLVYNNPSAYAASGGIYIDGAKSVIIENNICYGNDYGIEVGCENNGNAPNDPSASNIIVRNNIIYNNKTTGISLGGYDYPNTGKVENVKITNNTLYSNDIDNTYNGELLLFYVENSTVENNIFYTKNSNKVMVIGDSPNPTLSLDYNLYYAPTGEDDIVIEIAGIEYNTFSAYQTGYSQDLNSTFSDPLFFDLSSLDFHIGLNSPSLDAGNPSFNPDSDETDMDSQSRVFNSIVDCGADEFVEQTAEISTEANEKTTLISPNPVNETLFIQGISNFDYIIYSLDGKQVCSELNKLQSIDVSNLTTGTYFVKIVEAKSNYIRTIKIVKQ